MSSQRQNVGLLDRRLYLVSAILAALWLASLAALGGWLFVDRDRSAHILDYHRASADLSSQLLQEALALQRDLVSWQKNGADKLVAGEIYESRAILRQLAELERAHSHPDNVGSLERTERALQKLDAALLGPGVTDSSLAMFAEDFRYRVQQLQRVYLLDYNAATRLAAEQRSEEQNVITLTVLLLSLIALLVFIFMLRYIRRSNKQLIDSASLLQQALRVGNLGYSRWTANRRFCVEASVEFLDMFGLQDRELDKHPLSLGEFESLIHPLDQDYSERLESLPQGEEISYRIITPESETRFISELSEAGQDEVVLVITRDITEIRQAQEQLMQSQKMEVVGQLTGGVAHDFNNILAVVLGSLELIEQGELQPRQREFAQMALQAARRGATLTRQLLAFARRQPLDPEQVRMDELLLNLDELFRRTLGENIAVELFASSSCWPCMVDRNQLESALFNLVLNARDAMPDGGRLMIEASNVDIDASYAEQEEELEPGSYVAISISDNGKGMPPELADRVFEPFFTTKEVGKGTGLGLSMVFGFAKQSRGHVKVYSEVGEGTTFTLYLPRAEMSEERPGPGPALESNSASSARTVLVVEDDIGVLDLVVEQLTALGYQTLRAGNAAEALEVLAAAPQRVDILLTDLVLPGELNGKQLADRVVDDNPKLVVTFMSGYTRNAVVHHGRLDPGTNLLQKPFSQAELKLALERAVAELPEGATP